MHTFKINNIQEQALDWFFQKYQNWSSEINRITIRLVLIQKLKPLRTIKKAPYSNMLKLRLYDKQNKSNPIKLKIKKVRRFNSPNLCLNDE